MYVRLAFAIAAHLDPDILIVDEVLAVGDAEFQRKCIGKMNQVSTEQGKTILFVSHNSQALKNLCNKAIYLEKGRLIDIGQTDTVINNYLKREQVMFLSRAFDSIDAAPGNDYIKVKSVNITPHFVDGLDIIDIRTSFTLHFEFWFLPPHHFELSVRVVLKTMMNECIFMIESPAASYSLGLLKGECTVPGNYLNDGSYTISLQFIKNTYGVLFEFSECLSFDVQDYRANTAFYGKWDGFMRPKFNVELQQTQVL